MIWDGKKIPTQASHLINPKNYLAKDEYLIDYDKDSEDEFMEENAEDIKSYLRSLPQISNQSETASQISLF